jgi:ankyrin repeat protein
MKIMVKKYLMLFILFSLLRLYAAENITPFIENLQIFKKPDPSSDVIRTLKKYEILKIISLDDYKIINNVRGRWTKVEDKNKIQGWCFDASTIYINEKFNGLIDYTKSSIQEKLYGYWELQSPNTEADVFRMTLLKDGTISSGEKWEYNLLTNKLFLSLKNNSTKLIEKSEYEIEYIDYGRLILKESDTYSLYLWRASNELIDAVKNGNLDKIKFMVENGFDVNAKVKEGSTALNAAIQLDSDLSVNKLMIIKYLIDNNADVKIKDYYNREPILSCYGDCIYKKEIFDLLLSSGADINAKDDESKNVLFYEAYYAILKNDMKFFYYMIRKGVDFTNADIYGNSIMSLFIIDNPDIIIDLIKNYKSINLKKNTDLLVNASLTKNTDLVKILIGSGVDVNGKYQGKTALQSACMKGNFEIIELLIRNKADVNAVSDDGNSALHFVSSQRYETNENISKIIDLLAGNKADLNLKNNSGRSPLHIAVKNNIYPVTEELIKNKADINLIDNDGNTPLHMAVLNINKYKSWKSYEKVIKLLIDNNASIDIKNKQGISCLGKAIYDKDDDLLKILENKK